MEGPRRPDIRRDATELVLEQLRFPHRRQGFELLAAGIRKRDQLGQCALGHAGREGTMRQGQQMERGLIERPGHTSHAAGKIEEVWRPDDLVLQADVVAPGTLEALGVPSVLDPPFVRSQQKPADQWRPCFAGRSGQRLAALGHHAEADDPIGMLATAGERPPSRDPPPPGRGLGRAAGLEAARADHVRAVPVDPLVGFQRQHGEDDVGDAADHADPADRAVDPGKRADDLQDGGKIELHPAVARGCGHAEDPDRSQGIYNIERDPARGLDLRGACCNVRGELADLGKHVGLGLVCFCAVHAAIVRPRGCRTISKPGNQVTVVTSGCLSALRSPPRPIPGSRHRTSPPAPGWPRGRRQRPCRPR